MGFKLLINCLIKTYSNGTTCLEINKLKNRDSGKVGVAFEDVKKGIMGASISDLLLLCSWGVSLSGVLFNLSTNLWQISDIFVTANCFNLTEHISSQNH